MTTKTLTDQVEALKNQLAAMSNRLSTLTEMAQALGWTSRERAILEYIRFGEAGADNHRLHPFHRFDVSPLPEDWKQQQEGPL